jgi:DNA-binding MarR family transcriptional regulator
MEITGGGADAGRAAGGDTDVTLAAGRDTDAPLAASRHTDTPLAAGRDTDARLAAGRDTDARRAASRHTDTPLAAGRDTDARRAASRHTDTPLAASRDTDTPLAAGRDTDARRAASRHTDAPLAAGRDTDAALAAGVAAALERLLGLFRWLSPPTGLSLTAAATLATLERAGPCRLTMLADREAVTQPAMTQLVARLQEAGLVTRSADPTDGRVVQVRITGAGRAVLAERRAVRAGRLAGMLADLSAADRATLAAALPVMDTLVAAQRAGPLASTR